jgi:hypothetical protein
VRPVLLHPAQAEAIVSALEQIPARAMVPVEDLLEAEAQLVEAAQHLSPGDLRRLGAARQRGPRWPTQAGDTNVPTAARAVKAVARNADGGLMVRDLRHSYAS